MFPPRAHPTRPTRVLASSQERHGHLVARQRDRSDVPRRSCDPCDVPFVLERVHVSACAAARRFRGLRTHLRSSEASKRCRASATRQACGTLRRTRGRGCAWKRVRRVPSWWCSTWTTRSGRATARCTKQTIRRVCSKRRSACCKRCTNTTCRWRWRPERPRRTWRGASCDSCTWWNASATCRSSLRRTDATTSPRRKTSSTFPT
mmetsp:Transcript_8360/g.52132  ORF Transcript_8360/g.52132 Transcript_8360/m.52132 type:complete len:205 (-) Transcript_8360:4926-5540(-)